MSNFISKIFARVIETFLSTTEPFNEKLMGK